MPEKDIRFPDSVAVFLSPCFYAVLCILLYLSCMGNAHAMNAGEGIPFASIDSAVPVTLKGSVSYLKGQAQEMVYENGKRVSQLHWDLQNIAMVGGSVSGDLTNRMQFNIGGWAAVNSGSGKMIDWDWSAGHDDWSHRSISPVRLNHGYMADTNLKFRLDISKDFYITPMIGFKYDNWKWTDHGGSYIYSTGGGWRNSTGIFPDVPGIAYEQWFYTPYLGLAANIDYKGWSVNAYIKGSLWARAKDRDQHLLRNLEYKDTARNMRYLAVGAEAVYCVRKRLSITVAYDYQRFSLTDADTFERNTVTGATAYYPNGAAGIGFYAYMVTLSLGYAF